MNGNWLLTLVVLALIVVVLTPALQQRLRQLRRDGALQRLARGRGSRVLTLIQHRETYRFLGIPFHQHDAFPDPERVLRAIALTPGDVPIDLILHTPRGLSLAAEQLAHALIRHPARVTVFVPHYALDGGTLIALAADEIVLEPNAVLSPLDPQVGPYPAAALVALAERKPAESLDDRTLILLDQARKVGEQTRTLVTELLLARGMPAEQAAEVATTLTNGGWTQDYPILIEEASRLGLPVSDELPREVYTLLELYDTSPRLRPSASVVALTAD